MYNKYLELLKAYEEVEKTHNTSLIVVKHDELNDFFEENKLAITADAVKQKLGLDISVFKEKQVEGEKVAVKDEYAIKNDCANARKILDEHEEKDLISVSEYQLLARFITILEEELIRESKKPIDHLTVNVANEQPQKKKKASKLPIVLVGILLIIIIVIVIISNF